MCSRPARTGGLYFLLEQPLWHRVGGTEDGQNDSFASQSEGEIDKIQKPPSRQTGSVGKIGNRQEPQVAADQKGGGHPIDQSPTEHKDQLAR